MTNHDWFPGQEVTLTSRSSFGKKEMEILKIDRITPSGLAVIQGTKYNKDGYIRGRSQYNYNKIQPTTPEHRDMVKKQNLLIKISHKDFKELPLENLETIWNIINNKGV